jgi:glutamate--cysteine ligase catalytic subunit
MRFKPPPSTDSRIGWRVEFRSMDIQLTDFENSAMIVTLVMILNVINNYDVNLIMPITKIDENMDRAHMRDGLLNQKFWFKSKIVNNGASYKKSNLKTSNYLSSSFITKKNE